MDRADLAPARPHRALALLAASLVLAMTTWFSASAVVPQLRDDWGLGDTAAAWLTIAVQLGFVAGALVSAVLNVADVVPPRLVILAGARGGGRERPSWRRLGRRARRSRCASSRFLPRRRLPTRPQAHGHLVPSRTRDGARHRRRRVDPRLGDAPPRQRARRARLAHGRLRDLGPDAGGRAPRAHRARRPLPVPAGDLRPAPGPARLRQPRRPPGEPRLLRAHVGALRHVGVVRRLLLDGGGRRRGGRLRDLRGDRRRSAGLLGRRRSSATGSGGRRRPRWP